MKKENRVKYCFAICMLLAFVLWTLAVCLVDVQTIGPNHSAVGIATVNHWFHNLTGVHMSMYVLTDWLGLVPVAVGMGFAIFGLVQWIGRKSLKKVDFSILALGGFYVVVTACYILFEEFTVNYRPVLIEGNLEASYPSSTTLLVLCVMSTAIVQLRRRIPKCLLRKCISVTITAFSLFMVIGRLVSGVHWLSDIIGGVLLSAGLVMLYVSISLGRDRFEPNHTGGTAFSASSSAV